MSTRYPDVHQVLPAFTAVMCSANVFSAVSIGGQKGLRYRADLMIPLKAAEERAIANTIMGHISTVWLRATGEKAMPPRSPVKRGEDLKFKNGEDVPGLKGNLVISASGVHKPVVFGAGGVETEVDDGSIYPGAKVRVILKLYVLTDIEKPGVFAELRGIQHIAHGKQIGYRQAPPARPTLADFEVPTHGGVTA